MLTLQDIKTLESLFIVEMHSAERIFRLIENRAFFRKDMMANNDGLIKEDWINWFKSYDLSNPLAIIHFTPLRY